MSDEIKQLQDRINYLEDERRKLWERLIRLESMHDIHPNTSPSLRLEHRERRDYMPTTIGGL